MVHGGRIFGRRSLVDGAATFLFGQKLLDFPDILLRADAEFEIFLCDRVPVLKSMSDGFINPLTDFLTLYTIITPRRLQIVAKKSPSK